METNFFTNTNIFVLCLISLPFLLVLTNCRKEKLNIYNRFSGECLASGFNTTYQAEQFMLEYFGDPFSYESVKNDFVIDTHLNESPIFESYNPISFYIAPVSREQYKPKTQYYKNRISKYFDEECLT
jgi:hypothetical protein